MSGAKDYKVGYRRPPAEHQFQKGQSGNPRGRPKPKKAPSDTFSDAMHERVTVTIDGKRRSITKFEAACTQLANRAASGDPKAAKLVVDVMFGVQGQESGRTDGDTMTREARRSLDQILLAARKDAQSTAEPEAAGDEPE
jgi:hypothetical protein